MKGFITVSSLFFLLFTAVLINTEPAADNKKYPGIEMVPVKKGKFMMGKTDKGADYSPAHTVNISPFLMSKHEVTQKLYRDITGVNPCEGSKYGDGDLLPVYNVSWYEAVEFCNKLSAVHGLMPYYKIIKNDIDPANISQYDPVKWEVQTNSRSDGFRLPTEAQWEYACRAGTRSRFYWGSSTSWDASGRYSWHLFNTGRKKYRDKRFWWVKYHKVQKVGSRRPNAFGLYDMCGNVSEWCFDRYDVSYYSEKEETDPSGWKGDYAYRVFRGGAILDSPADFSSYKRWAMGAFEKQHTTGIRLVLPQ